MILFMIIDAILSFEKLILRSSRWLQQIFLVISFIYKQINNKLLKHIQIYKKVKY